MKIKAESYDNIVLEEVFNPISLISRSKEKLSIVMRDSGFELWYQDKEDGEYHTYEFKNGVVRKMKDEIKSSDIKEGEEYYSETYTKKQQKENKKIPPPPPPPSRLLKEGKEPPKPKNYNK